MARALTRGVIEVPNSAEAHAALALLNARLERLESARQSLTTSTSAPLDKASQALFVRYGAAMLSAPCAHAGEAAPDPAHSELNYGQFRLVVEALCDWLRLLKLVPRRVYCLEDFDAQIVGRAIAQQLEVQFEVADGDGFTHSKSLIVSADSRALTAPPLRTIFPSQVLYALNLHRETGAIAPDVASQACANLILPWHNERLSARKIGGIVERIAQAPRNALPSPSSQKSHTNWSARLEFYRAQRAQLSAGNSAFTRLSMLPEIN